MDRREFFSWVRSGLASAAAASLMVRDGTLKAGQPGDAVPACPHFAPKATRAIHICLHGAMSHIDTFDYKPGLIAAHGQSLQSPTKPDVFFGQVGTAAPARLVVPAAGPSGSLGVGSLSQPRPGGRRVDHNSLDGRRHLEPHARHFSRK